MAESAVVGTLRTLLTLDTSTFEGGTRKASNAVAAFERSLDQLKGSVASLEPQAQRMVNAFSGTKLLTSANNLTAAVTKIGGATKLTSAEQAKVNRTLTDAIAKYASLGKTAPRALIDLEKATRGVNTATNSMTAGMSAAAKQSQASLTLIGGMSKAGREAAASLTAVEKPASFLTTRMVALGAAIGSFGGSLVFGAVSRLSQSFLEAASNGAKFTALESSFRALTNSIGESGEAMLLVTRRATKGLISDLDLMQSSNKAILLGLPVTAREMGTLSQAAVTLGRAMGQDATKSLDDLITALGRSSPLILDNLGLTVKVGEANEAYARSIGKTASQLTDAEKKLAFYRAAMEAAEKKTAELGEITLSVSDQVSRLGTSLANVITQLASGANESRTFAGFLGDIADQADEVVRSLTDLGQARRNLGLESGGILTDVGTVAAEMRRIQEGRSRAIAIGTAPPLATPDGFLPRLPTDAEVKSLDDATKKLEDSLKKANEFVAKNREANARLRSEVANLAGEAWMAHDLELMRQSRVTGDALEGLRPVNDEIFLPSQRAGVDFMTTAPDIARRTAVQVRTVWDELSEGATRSLRLMDTAISGSFAQMLLGAKGFKDGYLDIWRSIQAGIVNILGEVLSYFTKQFLGGLIKSLSGAKIGQAIGNAVAGGTVGAAVGGGASAVAGTAGTAAGGAGASLAAFATNPFTLAAVGGAILGAAIWKKGLFRGGEEALKVSPRRDQFLAQFGGPGTGPESGFHKLAARLTKITGEPGGGSLHAALRSADSVKAFESAQAAIISALTGAGMKNVKAFNMGGFVPPGVVQPAILHGGQFGEDVIPRKGPGMVGGVTVHQHNYFTLNGQALDTDSWARLWDTKFVPDFKREMLTNQRGLVSEITKAVA